MLKDVLHASRFWQTLIKNYTLQRPVGNTSGQSNAEPQVTDDRLLPDQHALRD